MGLREIKEAVDRRHPDWPRKQKIELIKELRDQEDAAAKAGKPFSLAEELGLPEPTPKAPSVRVIPQEAQIRAEETGRKQGLTFGDLCALVDKGRALGIDPSAVVLSEYWLGNKVPDRAGYRCRWMEI